MRIHYPKMRNMTYVLSLSVSIAFKGTNYLSNLQKLNPRKLGNRKVIVTLSILEHSSNTSKIVALTATK